MMNCVRMPSYLHTYLPSCSSVIIAFEVVRAPVPSNVDEFYDIDKES